MESSDVVPFFAEVAKEWLAYKKPKIRISTWEDYQVIVKNHFSELNACRISEIRIATVERFITKRQNEGMKINTLRRILVTLNQILNYAVRHGLIDHNPAREAEKPRRCPHDLEEQNTITVLQPPELRALIDNVGCYRKRDKEAGHWVWAKRDQPEVMKYKALFKTAALTGLRQGELLGLKWPDIDFETGQIHVQRTFNSGRFFSPKSRTSNRRVDIGPELAADLNAWRLVCPENELNLVFPSKAGTPLDHHYVVRRYLEPAIKKTGIPRIRFHDLRHGFASLLIHQGENIKYIQSQLGHASPVTTLNIYAHLLKPSNPEAASKLEETVFGFPGSSEAAKQRKEGGDDETG